MTAADVTKKQPRTTQQALGTVLASLSLHKNQPGLRGAKKSVSEQGQGTDKTKPGGTTFHSRVPSQSRSQTWGRTGWESIPSLCLSYLEHLLGGGLRAPPPWDRLSLGLASHGGVSKRKLVFCLPFPPAELCSSDRNGGALARGKTVPGKRAPLFISDFGEKPQDRGGAGVPAAPHWFSPRMRAPRPVPWLEVFDPLRQTERFGAVAARSIPWACSSPFPRKSRWKSESLVQPIHTPPCSSAGSEKSSKYP